LSALAQQAARRATTIDVNGALVAILGVLRSPGVGFHEVQLSLRQTIVPIVTELLDEAARRRLTERYGSDQEKRWIADPNAPLVDPLSLLHAFLCQAGPANVHPPELHHAPPLERADALAAARLIILARRDAQQREIALMRQIRTHGVSWNELADALDTTAETSSSHCVAADTNPTPGRSRGRSRHSVGLRASSQARAHPVPGEIRCAHATGMPPR